MRVCMEKNEQTEKIKWLKISIQSLINEVRTLYESLYGEKWTQLKKWSNISIQTLINYVRYESLYGERAYFA